MHSVLRSVPLSEKKTTEPEATPRQHDAEREYAVVCGDVIRNVDSRTGTLVWSCPDLEVCADDACQPVVKFAIATHVCIFASSAFSLAWNLHRTS